MGQLQSTSAAACPPTTAPVRHIFAFGDSFSSTAFQPRNTPPTACNPLGNPTYPGDTYDDEPNWFDVLVKTAPYNTLGYDLAVDGATVNQSLVTFPLGTYSFINQTAEFIDYYGYGSSTYWSGSDSAFIIWFGVNDIGLSLNISIDAPVLSSYFNEVQSMFNVGARRFLFMGVPPFWRMPIYYNTVDTHLITRDAAAWNALLQSKMTQFQQSNDGAKVAFLDTQPLFDTILNDPTAYCAPNALCNNTNGVSCLWYDEVHPGVYIQQNLGQGVFNALVSEGFFGDAATVTPSLPNCAKGFSPAYSTATGSFPSSTLSGAISATSTSSAGTAVPLIATPFASMVISLAMLLLILAAIQYNMHNL